jgi:hypothetical protein
MTIFIDILRRIGAKTGGTAAPALSNSSDEPFAARSLEDRTAAVAAVHRLVTEGETMGVKLAREGEQKTATRIAKERDAEEARKDEERAKTALATHSWGVEVRISKLRAELARGASPLIDQTIAELARVWEAARVAGRHIGAMRSPLTQSEIDDNFAADRNLAGLVTAQQEVEALKYEALSEPELAAALERIIAAIPPRYPQHEPIAIALLKKTGAAGRTRLAHDGAKAVMA